MLMFLPYPGACLLMPSGPADDPGRNHLFVVLTPPHSSDDVLSVLTVSLSTWHDDRPCDDSCVLDVGDHPFVRHRSFIRYNRARISPAQVLIDGVQKGDFRGKQSLDVDALQRVIDGLNRSPDVTPRVARFYRSAVP